MYLIFVSTLNANVTLANKIKKQLLDKGMESEIINLVSLELPLYDTQKEQLHGIPKTIATLIEKMDAANGYVFATAEYNYSLPPVLSNFIAWVSRSSEDFRKVFTLKHIQLATHSGSGGSDVMNAMRSQFTKLGAVVMPREIINTYTRHWDESSGERILDQFLSLSHRDG